MHLAHDNVLSAGTAGSRSVDEVSSPHLQRISLYADGVIPKRPGGRRVLRAACTALGATVLAFLILGYHPYAEDGGIYSAAVAARLDPRLFPYDRAFVIAHTRFALFVPLVAALVRVTHFSAASVLLLLYLGGLVALIAAGMHLAKTCLTAAPRWTAAVGLAFGMSLPVAGTSLYAVDPYCTARSLTSPLLLFAFSFALRQRWRWTVPLWIAAAALHPLMALWSALPLLLCLLWTRKQRFVWLLFLMLLVVVGGLFVRGHNPPLPDPARAAVATRAYWFLAQWRWYELFGAIAPPCLLCLAAVSVNGTTKLRQCAQIVSIASALAFFIALGFAREHAASFNVASLQPMRTLHLVFLTFLALAGPSLALLLRSRTQRTLSVAAALAMGVGAFALQRATFPHTRHTEWPGADSGNAWQQAFVWCRDHTPPQARIALPANYINLHGEDSHGFRAIALRSTLPDVVKDAGVTAVMPAMSEVWANGVRATSDLVKEDDSARRAHLLPSEVTWIVLPSGAPTSLPCPFVNAEAKVCSL